MAKWLTVDAARNAVPALALVRSRGHIAPTPSPSGIRARDQPTELPNWGLKGSPMTPQFLRSEAARFREMAEGTEREASRQRLLSMADDYESRAAAQEALRPTQAVAQPEPEPPAEEAPEPPAEESPEAETDLGGVKRRPRLRLTRAKPIATS
jgi:hypothetical protein